MCASIITRHTLSNFPVNSVVVDAPTAMRASTLCLALLLISFPTFSSSSADTIASDESLTENQTLVSSNQMFELGFFSPGRSGKWYLGMWYKNTPDRTVVWVANRDNPLSNSSGVALKIAAAGNIVVLDQIGAQTWSSNQNASAKQPVLQLLGSGNLVLRESDDSQNYIWQSFDHPTDTLLPDMKLGWDLTRGLDRNLTAWKSADDPGTGDYSFKLDFHGSPEIFLYQQDVQVYRSGPWNGVGFSGVPEMKSTADISFNFVTNQSDVYYSFTIREKLLKSRLTVNASGDLQRYTFIEDRQFWNLYWYAPKDQCDNYRECGPYGICDPNASPVCKCADGFEPKNKRAWELRDGSDGCERITNLDCSTDGFAAVKGMKLPDSTSAVVERNMSVKECKEACLKNCSCSAYASSDMSNGGSGSGCVMWTTPLLDLRHYSDGGQVLFLRLAASDLSSEGGKNKVIVEAVCITVGVCIVLSGLALFLLWKKKTSHGKGKIQQRGPLERSQDFLLNAAIVSSKKDNSGESQADDLELPLFDFMTIAMATDNFSDENLLGHGGFGCVYKASLLEGEEVAVKRLSKNSGQGVEEFKNEVKLIARLQHRNLVRLLGCCVETDEKILIYELMENKSLDSIIFDPAKTNLLNWQRRFSIICGIARGLLYLHQDSRFRIIHRDLKASNILLDGEMDPKISDFGMARIFGGDQTEGNTRRIVGTYGYMSPEYAMDGLFSVKSDVFSFGVLVLEIVSGKKNRGFYYANHELNLLGYAWKLWREGRGMELVDSSMGEELSTCEVTRCIQVGLLCVQEHAEDRPTMATVLLMLSSDTATMPQPKNPGFCLGRNPETESSSSKQDESCTVNQVTVTMLDAR